LRIYALIRNGWCRCVMTCNDDVLVVRLCQNSEAMSCVVKVRRNKRQLELSAIVLPLCACAFANHHHAFLMPNMLFSFHHRIWRWVCSTLLLVTSRNLSCISFGSPPLAGWRRANENSKAGTISALTHSSLPNIPTFCNKQQRWSRRGKFLRSVR